MKIALCLMGAVGAAEKKYGVGHPIDPRIGHYFYKKHIFDCNDVDVFIHSWSTDFEKEFIELYNPKKYLIEKQINFNQNDVRTPIKNLNTISKKQDYNKN